jgi:hypothetical protein
LGKFNKIWNLQVEKLVSGSQHVLVVDQNTGSDEGVVRAVYSVMNKHDYS